MRKFLFCILLLHCCALLIAQEICDNGIDDDNNGKIDLLDPACKCDILPKSPIDVFINPSFEDLERILDRPEPNFFYKEHLKGWFNPSSTRSYYFHESRNFEPLFFDPVEKPTTHRFPDVPIPIPDGYGMMGMVESVPESYKLTNPPSTVYSKSYVATCLTQPLLPGNFYQLNVDVGIGLEQASDAINKYHGGPPQTIAIYGFSGDCKLIPNRSVPNLVECLSVTTPQWKKIATGVARVDAFGWTTVSLRFAVPEKVTALAIGPDCSTKYQIGLHGYYIDNLKMFRATIPIFQIENGANPNFCIGENPAVKLQISHAFAGSSIQWYKDGKALVGEKGFSLEVNGSRYGEGSYQCYLKNDTVCLLSDSFAVKWSKRPAVNLGADTTLCFSETMMIEPGVTDIDYKWHDGSNQVNYFVRKPGTYSVTLSNSCATVSDAIKIDYKECLLDLTMPTAFTPNNDGKNDVYRIRSNHVPTDYRMQIFNRYGQVVFESKDATKGWDGLIGTKPAVEGPYVCIVEYGFVGRRKQRKYTSFMLIR